MERVKYVQGDEERRDAYGLEFQWPQYSSNMKTFIPVWKKWGHSWTTFSMFNNVKVFIWLEKCSGGVYGI